MIRKISCLLLSSIFLISASNATNSENVHKFSADMIAIQHTITNLIDMQEYYADPTLNKDKICGFDISAVNFLFNLDDFKKSPQGNARKFLNDMISCMVNCKYEKLNELENNKIYKQLCDDFNNINNILHVNTDDLNNAQAQTLSILDNTRKIFLETCKVVKGEDTETYNFIPDDINNENSYRKLQFDLGKSLFQKSQKSIKPES